MEITQDYLKSLFIYDSDSGYFWWKIRAPRRDMSKPAGGISNTGHVRLRILDKKIMAHVAAWIYVYGEMPQDEIDHINGNGADNSIRNLRLCSHAENMRNRKIHKNNKCGYKGVYKDKGKNRSSPWRATIRVNNKVIRLGYFKTPELAHIAYCEASINYHGNFSRFK